MATMEDTDIAAVTGTNPAGRWMPTNKSYFSIKLLDQPRAKMAYIPPVPVAMDLAKGKTLPYIGEDARIPGANYLYEFANRQAMPHNPRSHMPLMREDYYDLPLYRRVPTQIPHETQIQHPWRQHYAVSSQLQPFRHGGFAGRHWTSSDVSNYADLGRSRLTWGGNWVASR